MADQDYQRGLEAYERGDDDAGREWFEKAADQGYADAQYELGSDLLHDDHDLPRSKSWLLAAAEQGHAEACMNLCYLEIEFGLGEPEGIKWYRRARELGHPHDAFILGITSPYKIKLFFGTFENFVSRVKRRAKRGDAEDQYLLGCWYAEGKSPFPQNLIRAYAWFVVAAGSPPQDLRRALSHSQARHAPAYGPPLGQEDWDTPMRAVRLLEQVLDDDERRLAHRLANYYVDRFSQKEGFWLAAPIHDP